MIGLKRFIRPAFVVSVTGHVGALLLGLLFVGANSLESTPPDAMVVDIVPPNEAPRFAGAPSDLGASGSESASKSNNVSAAAQPPPPPPPRKSATQSQQQQQPQQRPSPRGDASQAPAQPHSALPETTRRWSTPRKLSLKHRNRISRRSRRPPHHSRNPRRRRINRAPPRCWRSSRSLADGSVAASPPRRSTPPGPHTTSLRHSVNASVRARPGRMVSTPAIISVSSFGCPSTATAPWRRRRNCSSQPHHGSSKR